MSETIETEAAAALVCRACGETHNLKAYKPGEAAEIARAMRCIKAREDDMLAAEMARLLEAMLAQGLFVTLAGRAAAGNWRCEWDDGKDGACVIAKTPYEAVKACWERGQGS